MAPLSRVALLLLLLATPLAAQTQVSFSSLDANKIHLRFFPSISGYPYLAERVYPESFDSATTRFINIEIGMDYPKVTAPVSFQLDCQYQGPRFENEGAPVITGNIQAGWTASFHAGGWGNKDGAHFPVGQYTVTCWEGQKPMATGNFTVTNDRFDIPDARAMAIQIRMYESPNSFVPMDQRSYASEFDGSKSRFLKTEIHMVLPKTSAKVTYSFECTYRYPDGHSESLPFDNVYAEAGWFEAYHSSGLGSETPGRWAKGVYHVTCQANGRVFAERDFTVY